MVSVPVPEEGWLNQMSLVMSVCERESQRVCDGPSVVAPRVSTLSDPSGMPGRSMQLSLDGGAMPPPPVVRRVKLPVAPCQPATRMR